MFRIYDPDVYRRHPAHATYALIAINVAVSAVMFLGMSGLQEIVTEYRFGMIPWELTGHPQLGIERIFWQGQNVRVDLTSPIPTILTIFTSMFLHGSWLHVGGNMLFLWVFGNSVEDRLGHVGYSLFYLAAGVVAAWTQVATDPTSQVPVIGASGAIAGVLGAYLVMFPLSRMVIFRVPVPAALLLGSWILTQVFMGTVTLGSEPNVAYFAHIGGFAAGVTGTWLLRQVRLV